MSSRRRTLSEGCNASVEEELEEFGYDKNTIQFQYGYLRRVHAV